MWLVWLKKVKKHFDFMKNFYNINPPLEHYGLMVDLYGRVSSLRQLMTAEDMNEVPGCSVIEIYDEVHEFIRQQVSVLHPRYCEIEIVPAEISSHLRLSGYVDNNNSMIFNAEDKKKVITLCSWPGKHSEKLASHRFWLFSLKGGPG